MKVRDAETVGEEAMLQLDHVRVRVMRKLLAEPVTRLARLPVTDVVGDDDEVFVCVEQPARLEQDACEVLVYELLR